MESYRCSRLEKRDFSVQGHGGSGRGPGASHLPFQWGRGSHSNGLGMEEIEERPSFP